MTSLLLLMALMTIPNNKSPVDLVRVPTQGTMVLYKPGGMPLGHIKCNRHIAKPLAKAIKCMQKRHPDLLPMTYHGCYNPRVIAGTKRPSMHTYGMAIDLNAEIGVPERMAVCFEEAGFTWGGRWSGASKDDMHFEIR